MGGGMQWHQLDHMQTICTSLLTDNHTNTSSLNFLQAGCCSRLPTNSVKAVKAVETRLDCNTIRILETRDITRREQRAIRQTETLRKRLRRD